MGILGRLGARLSETSDEIHAQNTKELCADVEGVQEIASCAPRTRTRVVGVVESIKLVPAPFGHTLEVQVFDGTERLVGVWLGTRSIPGIDLGSSLILEGVVGKFGPGLPKLINPAYELLPRESAG
ncbi:MAG TPA: nucleotide-binding protein [Actinomycetota bacterium]|jgi:translation initiation factor 2B subunit (eIF-2B alpha/beta/delta family)|nr:nucleotide-binding protein [Actinomycetota bacterium]